MDELNDLLIKALTEAKVISVKMEGLRWFAVATALASLHGPDRVAAAERTFAAASDMLLAQGKESEAEYLSVTARLFEALAMGGRMEPAKAMEVMIALQRDAGADKSEALVEWWLTATAEEIEEEIRRLLGKSDGEDGVP